MRLRVERDERDPPPFERDPLRPLGRMRVDKGTDGQDRRCWRHIVMTPKRVNFFLGDFATVWTRRCHGLSRKLL